MSQVPPRKFSLPIVNFELSVHKKSITNPVEFRTYFAELLESFIDYTQIYTDESKDANKTALAVVYLSFVYSKRLPDKSSIFTAELEALISALRYVKVTNTDQKLCFVGFPVTWVYKGTNVQTKLPKNPYPKMSLSVLFFTQMLVSI